MNQNKSVALWLFIVSGLIVVMVVFGGWVRLTRSGLSMVDWHIVTGTIPPLSAAAWDRAFEEYQQTPEYRKINVGMSLAEFKAIYYREYGHRILGRLTGLAFLLPFIIFALRGTIRRRQIPLYAAIGILFLLQGLLGWFMVKSGLVDNPQVSHYRLTLHLLGALALLAACLWLGFGHAQGEKSASSIGASPAARKMSVVLVLAIVVQIAAGGLVAGLKAGYISDTFPRMFDQWIPDGLWALQPWIANPVENPALVHFQHRWFALVPLVLALALFWRFRREASFLSLQVSARILVYLIVLQGLLGIALVVGHVPIFLASLHQAVALAVFGLALFICHRAFRT